MVASDLVTGFVRGAEDPDDELTREQFATMLYRYARMKDYDVSAAANFAGYSDAEAMSDWARDAMRWAVAEGLINGTSDTTIEPSGTVTRARCVTILMWFVEL
jgi:hypothetical protein